MFKSAIVYRIASAWTPPSLTELEEGLARNRFVSCGTTEARSDGWIEPRRREHGALVESVAGQLILELRTETRAVPASAVKAALDQRLQRVEDETGSRPRGRQRKALKEEIVLDLLPRAFSKFSTTRLWLAPRAGLLVVGAGSMARADEAVAALIRSLRAIGSDFSASPVKTALAPATAMSQWLAGRQAPAGFSLDRECELQQAQAGGGAADADGSAPRQAGEGKATVRYARHSLDLDEIVAHVEQGKSATRLAMTWRDRVSFVLDAAMSLKRIALLDVVLDDGAANGAQDAADDGFDADVAIATGELGRLIPDLVDALGGEGGEVNRP